MGRPLGSFVKDEGKVERDFNLEQGDPRQKISRRPFLEALRVLSLLEIKFICKDVEGSLRR